MTRPDRLVIATGTGTDVGKTWWGAQTLGLLRARGVAVAARKPVQSGTTDHPTDAEVLAAATGERPDDVCPPHRCFAPALAPPIAAAQLGAPPFTITELVADLAWPEATALGWVEGAGGPRSPLATDGDTVDLATALRPDLVVLVADSGLGAINAVRCSLGALDRWTVIVALSRFDPDDSVHAANHDWLEQRDGLDLVTEPARLADFLSRADAT